MAKSKDKEAADDIDLLTRIKDDFKGARKHSSSWRMASRESYQFIAGGRGQWSEEDTRILDDNGRPVITFNRIGPYIDAVSGQEINSRHTIKYLPRTVDDSKKDEIYTAAVKWVRDNCNAEDEESDAFTDVLACGMGWIETAMDYEQNLDGEIVLNRVDPGQMYWDPAAKKRNLEDRRWQSRAEWMSESEIDDKWPDHEELSAGAGWQDDPEEKAEPHNASLAFLYQRDATGYDEREKKYRVVHYQWFELEDVYRVQDPQTGKIVEFNAERWKSLKKHVEASGAKFVKQKKRNYHQVFYCGDAQLAKNPIKCGSFTFKAITGKRNKIDNTWYGLVENMKDPQRWANKFFSQILHIVNSNAKGGLMAETGAFVDPKKAEEMWADPTAVILLKNGGLAKVKERTAATFPQALDRLMNYAVGAIPASAGINLETMGMVDREQAGVLEQERKKATFTILAPFFDSLRRYRKEEGRLLFHFINDYISDGRLIRITTAQGEQMVPLVRQPDDLEYDIIVDEAPTTPNQKEETWATMGKLIPVMMKEGMPIPPDFFTYSPLPTDLAKKMTEAMQNRVPPQLQAKMQEMQQMVQKLGQENTQLKQDMSLEAAKIHSKDQQAAAKATLHMEELRQSYIQDKEALAAKYQMQLDKLNAKAEEQQQGFKHDLAMALLEAKKEFIAQAADHGHQTRMAPVETLLEAFLTKHEATLAASSEAAQRSHEKAMQEVEQKAEEKASAAEGNKFSTELKKQIDSIKPKNAIRIFDDKGNMIAADITYASGETRRVTTPTMH